MSVLTSTRVRASRDSCTGYSAQHSRRCMTAVLYVQGARACAFVQVARKVLAFSHRATRARGTQYITQSGRWLPCYTYIAQSIGSCEHTSRTWVDLPSAEALSPRCILIAHPHMEVARCSPPVQCRGVARCSPPVQSAYRGAYASWGVARRSPTVQSA